jgi:hypothetical protein
LKVTACAVVKLKAVVLETAPSCPSSECLLLPWSISVLSVLP